MYINRLSLRQGANLSNETNLMIGTMNIYWCRFRALNSILYGH